MAMPLTTAEREELEQLDQAEAANPPLDHAWPPKVDDPKVTESFWRDPDPGNTAVLTADLIYEYNYEVGRMIRPFQTRHLNSASYDLTLGPRCLLDGKEQKLSERKPILRIPPGSIALAPSLEMLFVPHWLVATFNLKSYYIFKGLLMGAGPQVDPGFMGVLTFPLHNISCEPVDLHFGKPFAKLDFIRTSWGATVDIEGIKDEVDLYEKARTGHLKGKNGIPVMLWPKEKNFRQPLITGREPAGLKGFLRDLKAQIQSFRTQLKIGWAGALGVAALLATIIAAVLAVHDNAINYTDGKVEDVRNDLRAEAKEALREFGYPDQAVKAPPPAKVP